MKARRLLLSTTVLSLAACVELPTEPTVTVMPAPYKPFEVFNADQQTCRQYAQQTVATAQNDDYYGYLQYHFNAAYEQCMYARGNQVPGFAAVSPPPPPPPPGQAPIAPVQR